MTSPSVDRVPTSGDGGGDHDHPLAGEQLDRVLLMVVEIVRPEAGDAQQAELTVADALVVLMLGAFEPWR